MLGLVAGAVLLFLAVYFGARTGIRDGLRRRRRTRELDKLIDPARKAGVLRYLGDMRR